VGTRYQRPEYSQTDPFSVIPDLPELESEWHVMTVFANPTRSLQFEVVEQVVIGRRCPENSQPPDIDLAQYGAYPAGVSRRHAVLRRDGGRMLLMDLGSSNGTMIGNERLRPNMPTPVLSGDTIRFGRLQAWIFFK
jgi:pSer/pThr/pTyr-binding forkhead associated (FHA) protein